MRRPGQSRGDVESHDLDFLIHPAESLDGGRPPAVPRTAGQTDVGQPDVGHPHAAGPVARRRRRLRQAAVAVLALTAVGAAAAVNASRADRSHPDASHPATTSAPVAPTPRATATVDDQASAETLFVARFPDAETVPHVTVAPLTTPGLLYSIVFMGDAGAVIESHVLVAGKPYPFEQRLAFGGAGSTSHAPLVLHADVTGGAMSCPKDFAVRPGRLYTIGCTLTPQPGTGVVTFSVRTSQRMIASGSIVFAAH